METMRLQPKPEDALRIKKALNIYMVTSVITGIMLLLLCTVMVMKYWVGVHLFLFSENGVFDFRPIMPEGLEADFTEPGFDLFKAILIAHGWFYVVYLISDFMLWSPMRWGFSKFLLIALGGVIPFLSFFMEARIAREVNATLASLKAARGESVPDGTGAPAGADTAHSSRAADTAPTTEGRE